MQHRVFCQNHKNEPVNLISLQKQEVQNRLICFQCLNQIVDWCPIQNLIDNPIKILRKLVCNTSQQQILEVINKFENDVEEQFLKAEKEIKHLLYEIRKGLFENSKAIIEIKNQIVKKKYDLYSDLELDLIIQKLNELQNQKNNSVQIQNQTEETITQKFNELFYNNGQKLQTSFNNFELQKLSDDYQIENYLNTDQQIQNNINSISRIYQEFKEKIEIYLLYLNKC